MSLINIIAIAAQPAGTAISLMARVYVGMMIGLIGALFAFALIAKQKAVSIEPSRWLLRT